MAEPNQRRSIDAMVNGVACGISGRGLSSQHEAEEHALAHLIERHRAAGGMKLPKGRGTARRIRKIDEWNDRRRTENAVHGRRDDDDDSSDTGSE